MDNVHFNMNLNQRKRNTGTWMLTVSVSCSIVSLYLNPWESPMHSIFLILSIAASLFRRFHCNFLPKGMRDIQHVIGAFFAIPPVVLSHNWDQNLMYFNIDLKSQVILLLDLTSSVLKVVNIIFNIRTSSHSSKHNTLRKLQEQAKAIIDAQTKIIQDLSISRSQAKSMHQSQNQNNKTDLKSTRLNNLDPNKRQLSQQIIKNSERKQKESSEDLIKATQAKQTIKIGFENKKNNYKKVIQNYQDESLEQKRQGNYLQNQESQKVVYQNHNDALADQILQEKKIINPKKEIIYQNGIYLDKNCPKQDQLFKSPALIEERKIEDVRLRKQADSNHNPYHLNKNSQKSILLTQKKNPYSTSTSKQHQQEQQYPLESLINCQELPNTLHSLLLESHWCIKTNQNLSAELPNCDENHNNQSKPDFSEQSSAIASEPIEQQKMEQMNSTLKNKWKMKQRFLCDKKCTSTPFFQSTGNVNSGSGSELENKSDFSLKVNNGQVQQSQENEENKQKQQTIDLALSFNIPMMSFVKPFESDTKMTPKVIGSTISEDDFLNIFPPTADSPVEIKEISNDSINTNQIQIQSILQTKSDKSSEISKFPDLKKITNEQDDETEILRNIKNDTEQQQNTFSCTRQKSPVERLSNAIQKPIASAGGDEYEISTNDESNFTSSNSAFSQTIQPDSHSKKYQNLNKIPKKPQSQQLKRSISGNSIGKSKSTMQISFSADDISTKDNQTQSNKVHQKQKQQSISIPDQLEEDKRSSSQKCFEQFMYLKQGKITNNKEVNYMRNQLNNQEENHIEYQQKAPAELISQQQLKPNIKDCSVRQIPQNKVKQIAVRKTFEQDLHDDLDGSEEKGYDCSDNEDNLGDSSNSEDDDDEACIEDDSSEDDQSFSISSRSTLLKGNVKCLNTDLYSDFHSPSLSFAQQQLNSLQNLSLEQKQQFSVSEEVGEFSKQRSQNDKYSKKTSTESQLFNEYHQACFLNTPPCEGDENEEDLKKKKKKQKSQEQKKNRRNKRKEKLKNKKKDSNKLAQSSQTINDYDNPHIDQVHQPKNEDSQHSNMKLKRLLDENLLEYFTITLSLSAHTNLSIYITDFYQFDEQFDLQSLSYGIDGSTILDAKINFIFQIITLQLYPAMADFFDSLLNSYSKIKQSRLLEKQNDFSHDIVLLAQAFIESINELLQDTICDQDANNQSEIQLPFDIFSAFTSELIQEQQQKSQINQLIADINSSLNSQKEELQLEASQSNLLQLSP